MQLYQLEALLVQGLDRAIHYDILMIDSKNYHQLIADIEDVYGVRIDTSIKINAGGRVSSLMLANGRVDIIIDKENCLVAYKKSLETYPRLHEMNETYMKAALSFRHLIKPIPKEYLD